MSPNGPGRGGNLITSSNLYTVVLALAFAIVLATAVFVAYKCYVLYGTILGVP
ncbi:MAG: hypothetical protein ACYS76_08980 [Planctomycetota bacterium]|jgi:hypothetical protein